MLYYSPVATNLKKVAFFPLDFYRFRHTEEVVSGIGSKIATSRPLWIVGVSPFDAEQHENEGMIVHLGHPRFTARWTMIEERINQITVPDFVDDDLNIALYEVVPLDSPNMPAEEWLLEAVCAVGYSHGMITMGMPESH